jgi:hypothetical protein
MAFYCSHDGHRSGAISGHGDDAATAEATLRLTRLGGPDAVTFLRHDVRTERSATVARRVRAASAVLEFGGFLPSETKSSGASREPEGTDAAGKREEA